MEILEKLSNYCNDILEGKIKACKKHKAAVKRFISELEKQEDPNFNYEFNAEIVEDFYNWGKVFKHTKGVLANEPIELTEFQLFIVANIFGWRRKDTKNRRFKKSYIGLARKNAKSQLLALICSYEAFLSKEQGEIYISGWNKDTSDLVYNEILSQIKSAPLLKNAFSDSYKKITTKNTGSIIKALSREARRFGDGTNPSFVVADEFHLHLTSEIYDVMISGMVTRPNGHICIITTAGFSLNSPCFNEYKYIEKLLDEENPIENDEYFAIICELDKDDDIKDESNWIKANPIVATYDQGMDFLRSELKTALDMPDKKRNFLTKNMNIWTEDKPNSYIPLSKWNECEDKTFTLEQMKGLPCVVGVDLSTTLDLTSISFLFKKDDKLHVFNHSFMPEDTLEQKRKTDKVPYERWVEEGWITATPGSVVDYKFIEHYIQDLEHTFEFTIKEIAADPWNAFQFLQNMNDYGYIPIEVRQGHQTLGFPTKNFRDRVYQKEIVHDGNPVLSWSIGNAVTRADQNQNIVLSKDKSTERIDPIASAVIAHVRTMATLESGEKDLSDLILSDDWTL